MNADNLIGLGYTNRVLSTAELERLISETFSTWDLRGLRVLVIVPDRTRTAPIPLLFRLFHKVLRGQVKALDYLIALGTHPPLNETAVLELFGMTPEERQTIYASTRIFNHRWDLPETFISVGTISAEESSQLSGGLLAAEVPVRINRLVMDYDLLLVCGPVFPHEVVGFSGGSKYFSPGISGPEIINYTHWLGALLTSYEIIGARQTPVRDVIERVAEMIPRPKLAANLVVVPGGLAGFFAGEVRPSWSAAAELSAQVHVRYMDQPFQRVLSVMPAMYDDLWTGAKGMYKLEPVVADGGEIIIYAPHIREISYTHGAIIDQVGYHVRDYFLRQWDRFKDYPLGVLAHSTHLRGIGTYENGVETPRIQVSLATGIPPERCTRVNLNYREPAGIHPEEWAGREADGLLLVPKAGEILYRLGKNRVE